MDAVAQMSDQPLGPLDIEMPPDPTLGDFAFPCFRLSKALRKAPPQIAAELATRVAPALLGPTATSPEISVVATGPYVNFRVRDDLIYQHVLPEILRKSASGLNYGQLPPESRDTWVIEYSSPNVAKPFQIYHLRPTVLGAVLDKVGRYRGYRMVSINHLGDWGTQFGKNILAYKLWGETLPADPRMDDLVALYVRFHKEAETNPALDDQARQEFLNLEKGDAEAIRIWKRFIEISLKEFNRLYDALDIRFDHFWGESFYQKHLQPLIEDFKHKGIVEESEGALVVRVNDERGQEMPPCLLQKSDGASIYATRDLAAAIYRHQQFKFDRMTYVVGVTQSLHFKQIFATLKRAGYDWADRCEHIPTGTYRMKGAKMATRSGNFVTLEDSIDLARKRVHELIQERQGDNEGPKFTPAEMETVAFQVALGAVTFFDLSIDPVKDMEFDLERVVDFNGETGPYLQYAHTRCLSILRKAVEAGVSKSERPVFDASALSHFRAPEEMRLLKVLGQLPYHLERTLNFRKASQLCNYLIDVTKAFNHFYRECRVNDPAAPDVSRARLLLVEATRRILNQGLAMLGIPLPEKM